MVATATASTDGKGTRRTRRYHSIVTGVALAEKTEEAAARGGNAVVGVDLDYEAAGRGTSRLMVSASGTAVTAR